MIYLNTDNNADKIIVTLTELTTISPVFYLFVFTHVLSKAVVTFIPQNDESQFTDRYNQFEINTGNVFNGQLNGEWHYIVYQQDNNTNINPDDADGIVEHGKMLLHTKDELEFTQYNESLTFKTYNG